MLKVIFLIVLSNLYFEVKSGEVLLLSSVPSKSHGRWYAKISFYLAQHGHKVTTLSTEPLPSTYKHDNITYRTFTDAYGWIDTIETTVTENPENFDKLMANSQNFIDNLAYYTDPTMFGCDKLVKSKDNLNFMKEFQNKHFDLIIIDAFCECFFGYIHYFNNPPAIIATPFYDHELFDLHGLYNNPSYVPTYAYFNTLKMNFIERFFNTAQRLLAKTLYFGILLDKMDSISKEVFGESTAHIRDIVVNNVNMIMIGHHHAIIGAKPLPPNIIPVAGLQIEDVKPLPKDIKQFLDTATKGAILFSLGSNYKSILLGSKTRDMILDVFKHFPQKIIWKYEGNITDLPPNVMIKPWIPQNDILGHPNIVLFISHGGLNGIMETIHHGVPLLGLPIMFDQINNVLRLVNMGVGEHLEYSKLGKSYLTDKMQRLISNPSYRTKMKELSSVFRDNPLTRQDNFLYWVDFIIKHKSNIDYLKPGSVYLEWYQVILLDVFLLYTLIILITFWIIKQIVKLILNLICWKSRKSVTKLKKK